MIIPEKFEKKNCVLSLKISKKNFLTFFHIFLLKKIDFFAIFFRKNKNLYKHKKRIYEKNFEKAQKICLKTIPK